MYLSVIIPCLNEIDTIEKCIEKCFKAFHTLKIENNAEVIVADNGSTMDQSRQQKKLVQK